MSLTTCTASIISYLLLFLVLVKERNAQLTAAITPSAGYNASLDDQASFSFQCDVTGADDIRWIVDGLPVARQSIVDRGIFQSTIMTVDLDTGSLSRSLSISRNDANEHVTIICRADSFTPSATTDSDQVIFQVQGLLEAPPNLTLLETSDQCMRRISWGEPFSLDITDIEPDISHYNVCYSLRNADKSRCSYVNQTEFSFLNVSVSLLFTVSAVNVVGDGNSSSILYGGNNCSNTTGTLFINASQAQARVSYSFPGGNLVATFQFQQSLEDCQTACFPVYRIETSPLSVMNTTDHGIQIPKLVQHSQSSVLLSLTVDSDLVDNERYSGNITSVSAEGEEDFTVTIEFDSYDVQSVRGRAIAGGLELSCTFAEGSQAQSCTLSIYRILEIGMDRFIVNVSISRENLRSSGRVLDLELGEYVVREVAEVERDGQVTIHNRRDILNLMVNESAPATTSETTTQIPETPSSGGVSESPTQNTGAIVGGVLGGLCIVIIVVIVITVAILILLSKKKREEKNPNLLSENGSGTENRSSSLKTAEPTYSNTAVESSSQQKQSPSCESTDSASPTANRKLQNESPTSPLYTEIMGKGKPKGEEGDGSQPEVPQKQLTQEDLRELNLPTDEEIPSVPQQNLTTEDIQQMALSTETANETNTELTTSNQPDDGDDQPQLSCSLSQTTDPSLALSGGAAKKGDPLYAELEHKKGKQTITPPDMTGVQYSEIKTDEIPPRLPQKKSRKSRGHSSSSPTTSAPGSTTSLDTFKV